MLLHHVMGALEGRQGAWGYVQGGMGALSEAIASSATAHGASIFTEKVQHRPPPQLGSWQGSQGAAVWVQVPDADDGGGFRIQNLGYTACFVAAQLSLRSQSFRPPHPL